MKRLVITAMLLAIPSLALAEEVPAQNAGPPPFAPIVLDANDVTQFKTWIDENVHHKEAVPILSWVDTMETREQQKRAQAVAAARAASAAAKIDEERKAAIKAMSEAPAPAGDPAK
jgi:hypothetical protein